MFPVCRCYFALISLSGIFAVTFSVIFAYVADITEEQERSTAYGLVTPAPKEFRSTVHQFVFQATEGPNLDLICDYTNVFLLRTTHVKF